MLLVEPHQQLFSSKCDNAGVWQNQQLPLMAFLKTKHPLCRSQKLLILYKPSTPADPFSIVPTTTWIIAASRYIYCPTLGRLRLSNSAAVVGPLNTLYLHPNLYINVSILSGEKSTPNQPAKGILGTRCRSYYKPSKCRANAEIYINKSLKFPSDLTN